MTSKPIMPDSVNPKRDRMLIAELHSRWRFAVRARYPLERETQAFKRTYRRICSPITIARVINEAENTPMYTFRR